MEAEGGRYLAHNGEIDTLTYQMVVLLEEGLEMVGIVVFLYALMRYMELHSISLVVAVSSASAPRCRWIIGQKPAKRKTQIEPSIDLPAKYFSQL